jgi:hypothetical protein
MRKAVARYFSWVVDDAVSHLAKVAASGNIISFIQKYHPDQGTVHAYIPAAIFHYVLVVCEKFQVFLHHHMLTLLR